MADVRAQLIALMERGVDGESDDERCGALADAILELWDLTPKPVVTDEELGRLVHKAYDVPAYTAGAIGERMFGQLEAAGLTIVRTEDAK